MRRRLYFLLPDATVAQQVVDDLLIARIEARHIHILGRRGMNLGNLPEATVLQKTDVVHGAQRGAILGAALGALAGALFMIALRADAGLPLATILVWVLLGAFFGFWASSLVGAAVPNSRLKRFQTWIERGMLLLMVDVRARDTRSIGELIARRHPDAVSGGIEPTIPAFP